MHITKSVCHIQKYIVYLIFLTQAWYSDQSQFVRLIQQIHLKTVQNYTRVWNRILIFSDNYQLSLSTTTLPPMWVVSEED